MSFTEKYLTPYQAYQNLTFEQFCEKIPPFYFKAEVPEDVIKNFEVVEHLMALSYYQYKFIDEAFSKALLTFEMAMNKRYTDFNSKASKLGFNTLIIELTKLCVFDTDIETLKYLKFARNEFAHPKHHSFAGALFWHRIEFISRIINEMYEELDLRTERNALMQEFVAFQEKAGFSGACIMELNNKQIPVFSIYPLLINNKINPATYLLAYVPLFDLTSETERDGIVPEVFSVKIKHPVYSDTFTGIDVDTNQVVKVLPIKYNTEIFNEYSSWLNKYDAKANKFIYTSGIGFNIPDILIPEIKAFQKL